MSDAAMSDAAPENQTAGEFVAAAVCPALDGFFTRLTL
jgi:hypothetical protein